MGLRDALRRKYHTLLDAEDRARADSAIEAHPMLNTLMVDALDEDPLLQERYLWGVIQAAYLATSLDIRRLSVVEFGVGRGDGLVLLERAAKLVGRRLGVDLDVVGFDIATGVPEPEDPRDVPNMFVPGLYRMDLDATRARLDRAELIVGEVRDTVPRFVAEPRSPVGFAAFDFGSYHGTLAALAVLDAPAELLLPRVYCYFANVLGFTYGDCVGERLAIADYNARTSSRKLSPIWGLRHFAPRRFRNAAWPERYYLAHAFDHPSYGTHDRFLRHTPESYRPESFSSRT
jgi:hypothetical protein